MDLTIFHSLNRMDKDGDLISEPFISIFGMWMFKIGKGMITHKSDLLKYYGFDAKMTKD